MRDNRKTEFYSNTCDDVMRFITFQSTYAVQNKNNKLFYNHK